MKRSSSVLELLRVRELSRVLALVSPLAIALGVGCAGAQKPAANSPAGGVAASPAPMAERGSSTAAARAPARAAEESPLRYVPANAVAAAFVRRDALEFFTQYFAHNPELQKELSEYLERSLGLDLTRLEGLVAFSISDGQRPSGAVLLRLPGAGDRPLKLPEETTESGVTIHRLAPDVLVARVPGGAIVGSEPEVRAEIALAQHRAQAIAADAPLVAPLERDAAEIDVAIAVGPRALAPLATFGVEHALLVYRRTGLVSLVVSGDPAKLAAAHGVMMAGVRTGLAELETQKQRALAGSDPLAGAAAILSSYGARKLWQEIEPRLAGNQLVTQYQLPHAEMIGLAVPMIGVLAAVAIPAFMKYVRRSKTVEATMNVRKLFDSAITYREEHARAGKKFAWPASTDWTPARGCCGQPGDKCAPDAKAWSAPTWKALNFSVDDPHYYQYRFVTQGKGAEATFTVEARGDLDCDGIFSKFRRSGAITPDGSVTGGRGLETENDLE